MATEPKPEGPALDEPLDKAWPDPAAAPAKSAPQPAAAKIPAPSPAKVAPSSPLKIGAPSAAKAPVPSPSKVAVPAFGRLPAPSPAKPAAPSPIKIGAPQPAKAPVAAPAAKPALRPPPDTTADAPSADSTPVPAVVPNEASPAADAPRGVGAAVVAAIRRLSSRPPPPETTPSTKPEASAAAAESPPAKKDEAGPRSVHAATEQGLELAKGTVVAGKYRLERLLKAGGMGAVWVATHLTLDTAVAIKFMAVPAGDSGTDSVQGSGSDEGAVSRARFEREAKAAAQIRSANVVQILDYGIDRATAYIVMELLEGQDLEQRLKRTRISLDETAKIIVPVLQVLQRAHDAGVVHRDLKPANIFLSKDGDAVVPKVLDFGVAKAVQKAQSTEGDLTADKTLIGTPHYAAPEQIKSSATIDHRADLWSMGVVVFRMLTGRKPFRGKEIVEAIVEVCSAPIPKASAVATDLPPEVDAFFARALERDVAHRFQSAREMAQALNELVEAAKRMPPRDSLLAMPADISQDGTFSGSRDRPSTQSGASTTGPSIDAAASARVTQLAQSTTGPAPDSASKRPGWLVPALIALALGVAIPTTVVLLRGQPPSRAPLAASTGQAAIPGAVTPAVAPAAPTTAPRPGDAAAATARPAPTESASARPEAPRAASAAPFNGMRLEAPLERRPPGGHAIAKPAAAVKPAAAAKPAAPASKEDKEVGY